MINQFSVQKRDNFIDDAGASLVGIGAGYAFRTYVPKYTLQKLYNNNFDKWVKIPEKENPTVIQKLEEALNKINQTTSKKIQIAYLDENSSVKPRLERVKRGVNATFSSKENQIYLNKKFTVPGFHELQHAKDYVDGKLVPLLIASRYALKVFGLALPVFAICSKNLEETPEKPSNKWRKANNFIRNNIGKITLLAAAPILIAEGRANYLGTKLAKEANLSENVFKQIKKTHILSMVNYVVGAGLMGLSSTIGVKVKDYVAKHD